MMMVSNVNDFSGLDSSMNNRICTSMNLLDLGADVSESLEDSRFTEYKEIQAWSEHWKLQ